MQGPPAPPVYLDAAHRAALGPSRLALVPTGFFLVLTAWVCARLVWPGRFSPPTEWPEGLLLLSGAATALAGLRRELPGQSVVLASGIILVVSGTLTALNAATGVPFGAIAFDQPLGRLLFEPLPLAVPVVWLVFVLSARGTAQLVLRPWRQGHYYGFQLLGLTTALAVLLDLGLEPFAIGRGYWHWSFANPHLQWYGTPWGSFVGAGVSTAAALVLATPALINKRPLPLSPAYSPLLLWVGSHLLFLTFAAIEHFRTAALLSLVQLAVGIPCALAGARLNPPPLPNAERR